MYNDETYLNKRNKKRQCNGSRSKYLLFDPTSILVRLDKHSLKLMFRTINVQCNVIDRRTCFASLQI